MNDNNNDKLNIIENRRENAGFELYKKNAMNGEKQLLIWLSIFTTGVFFGPLITALAPFSALNWWLWPLFRSSWLIISGFFFGRSLAFTLGASSGKTSGIMVLSGVILSFNPVMDLAAGPVTVKGRIIKAEFEKSVEYRPKYNQHPSIKGIIMVERSDGTIVEIRPWGLQANRAGELISKLDAGSKEVSMTALEHLDIILELKN